ncbi:MAG: hypothetical protein K1X67_25955 [Fimbriimonadaceae bacterium]|nr:hypothetical protein [Fimbriimonadaceae bacterium]
MVYTDPNGTPFDLSCPGFLKEQVDLGRHRQDIAETVRRLPEFQAWWDKEGNRYLATAMREIGLPYPYTEVQATLTVCPAVTPMSAPLFMNVRPHLSSAKNPLPDWQFAFVVFRELMHTYILPVRPVSELRNKKYASEAQATLVHLHVPALEKFVLTTLGEAEKLRELNEQYRTRSSATYRRAWEIVSTEGHDAFLKEFKLARRQGK